MIKSRKLSYDEIASFCTQLSVLISAGITPHEAVTFMLDDSVDKEEQAILSKIRDLLFEGEPLSLSIKATNLFPDYMIDMLTLGEETGSLDLILSNLATYYDQQHSIAESIKSALIYPFIMTATMFFMILVLIINVLPTINQVYQQLGSSTNGFSSFLFTLSEFLQSISFVIYFLFFFMLFLFAFAYWKSKKSGRFPSFLLKLRFVSKLIYDKACSQFASCLCLVTSSGIDLYLGLSLIKNVISCEEMKGKIDACLRYLQEDGDYIYEALKKADIFQPSAVRMIQIGYKSGNSDSVLTKISKNYEEQIHISLSRLLNTVEPTLVIVFSVIVGLILISTLMPLIGIMANIG